MEPWFIPLAAFLLGAALTALYFLIRQGRLSSRIAALQEQVKTRSEQLEQQRQLLETAEARLREAFESTGAKTLREAQEQFLELASERFAGLRREAAGDLEKRRDAIANLLEPMRETLGKLEQRTGEIEKAREAAYSRIDEQVKLLAESAAGIQERAQSLEGALRGTQTRGRWGEVALRNIVELAGMSEHADFEEQTATSDGKRPDLTVHLPDGALIAVDAKVPLTAYMEAERATEKSVREAALADHCRALRQHVKTLASRDYASGLEGNLDLVVMFLPSDAILGAAFESDPELQEEAWRARVLIATPTTLVALLRTVAIYWQQKALAENAEQIAEAGQELYGRLGTFVDHLEGVGKGLEQATRRYNQAVGSLERSVLPSARRMKELHATTAGEIDGPSAADSAVREITSSELRELQEESEAVAEMDEEA